jgi:ectoine hydroxylase-related dioxygenase (phytanoyl-CoA dioxygenase family)
MVPSRRLSKEQVEAFFEVGFVVQPNVFSPAEVEKMRAAFVRLEDIANTLSKECMHEGSQFVVERVCSDPGSPGVRIHRVVWCGAAEPILSRYGMDRRLLEMAAQLLGSAEMNQLINQAHFKLPGDGVAFPWHQDSTHRRFGGNGWRDLNGRGSYVQTVTAVDTVTDDNGPLEFIPGSCRLGHVPLAEDGLLPSSLDARAAVSTTMEAGSVLLFGPYSFHCSRPNSSRGPRRVFINGFAYPGANARTYPGEGAGRLVRVS